MRTPFLLFAAACLVTSPVVAAQDSPTVEAQLKVAGICGMCKTRIEKAVSVKGVKYAKWNKSKKILTVAYLSGAISLDSLQQRIAAAGHDTQRFSAPDSIYASLPACCLYRDGGKTH